MGRCYRCREMFAKTYVDNVLPLLIDEVFELGRCVQPSCSFSGVQEQECELTKHLM